MPKYILAFTLLAFLVLENNSIFKRLHVESLPSSKSDETIRPRQSHHYKNQKQHQQQRNIYSPYSSSHHHRRHKRTHHSHQHLNQNPNHNHNPPATNQILQQERNTDFSIENDDLLAAHILRHQLHQMEHRLHHLEHYQTQKRSISTLDDKHQNLRSMPRPWQHLLEADEHMFGDEPNTNEYLNESDDVAENWQRNPLYTSMEAIKDEDFNEAFPMAAIPPDTDSTEQLLNENHNESGVESDEQPTMIPLNTENHEHPPASGHRCPKCEVQRQVEHITEEELTRLRIEFVKTQILEKLRLKERPNVSAVALPKPIQEGVTIDQGDENTKNKELDDYYARTSKKFIFLERETRECENTGTKTSICFSFKIDDADADGFDVNTAVLWIFKNKLKNKTIPLNNVLKDQETIVVSEVQQPVDSKFKPIVKTIAIQTVDVQDKWLEIDIEWPIKRWFGNHDLSHLIQISCESCDITTIEEMISIDKDYRPFIMIDTQNRRRTSRQKRGINCTDGVMECCREKLYISFEEIGWGDWIIQPRGYDAYFCRGACGTVASVTQSTSHHSTFLQKVIAMNRNNGRKPLELIPCCTAKQYSSLQLVFMDSNMTATQKTFPNMVVESCGCR